MSLLQRLAEWRRTKTEDRTAVAKSEQEALRAADEPEERDAAEDVLDAGSGTGATLD